MSNITELADRVRKARIEYELAKLNRNARTIDYEAATELSGTKYDEYEAAKIALVRAASGIDE